MVDSTTTEQQPVEIESVQEEPGQAPDHTALVEAWTVDAGTASAHGSATLVRFVTVSRDPAVGGDRECVPAFADLLADDPTALADVDVQAVSADAYRLVAEDVSIDVVVRGDRVFHQEDCGGSQELLTQAEAEAAEATATPTEDPVQGATESEPAQSEPATEAAPQEPAAPAAPTPRTSDAPAPSTPDPAPAAPAPADPVSHRIQGQVVQMLVPASSTCDHPDLGGRIGTIPPAQVVAKDGAGQIVAVVNPTVPGVLRPVGPSFVCEYEFNMDLPDSVAYTFELDNEDPLVVSRTELASMGWKLNLLQFEH